MLIGNLPIAGNAPAAVHNEHKQRVTEFRALESALIDGNIPSARHMLGLLRLNAPNAAQSVQKQREFKRNDKAKEHLASLEDALEKGDLEGARAVFAVIKREEESGREPDQNPPGEAIPTATPIQPPTANNSLGVSLDMLA